MFQNEKVYRCTAQNTNSVWQFCTAKQVAQWRTCAWRHPHCAYRVIQLQNDKANPKRDFINVTAYFHIVKDFPEDSTSTVFLQLPTFFRFSPPENLFSTRKRNFLSLDSIFNIKNTFFSFERSFWIFFKVTICGQTHNPIVRSLKPTGHCEWSLLKIPPFHFRRPSRMHNL